MDSYFTTYHPSGLSSTHFVFTPVRGSVWLRESARCDLVMFLILLRLAVMGVGLWLLCAHMRTQRDSVETKQPLKRLQEKKCRNSHMALLILPAPRSCCFLPCVQRWGRDVRMQKQNWKYSFYSVHAQSATIRIILPKVNLDTSSTLEQIFKHYIYSCILI